MEDQDGMIPMGGPEDLEVPVGPPEGPPTVKERNVVQQEVSRLLDVLAPERAAHRVDTKSNEVERHRTPRGCVLQAAAGAVSVSWFPDSAQGADLGELQVVAWKGTVSRPGSSQRASGATLVEELVLRPVEGRFGGLAWRVNEGATYSTDVLAARCNTLLEQWIKAEDAESV